MARDDSRDAEGQLRALLAAMHAVEAGDLSVRLPREPGDLARDEVARAFNAMVERGFLLRGDALARVGHELRTPLNAMLIMARVLADNPEGTLTPRQLEYAGTLLSSGRELLALLDDLLDWSKAEAGWLRVEPRELVLVELLPPLERAFRPVAEQRGLGFHLEVRPGTSPLLRTDPKRVQQVLRNLLSNAFKFTPSGEVRLTVEPAPEGRVAFTVADTGIGIAPESQRRVFEAFQQASGATAGRYGGTGLGLTISRELAHLLGGELRVASEPGRGSAFTLTLPAPTVRQESEVGGERPALHTPGEQPGSK